MLSFLAGKRRQAQSVREVLEDLGLSAEEIAKAEADGTQELLAIERLVLPGGGEFSLSELADKAGVDKQVVRTFWRAIGFPEPSDDEKPFNEVDLELIKEFAALSDAEVLNPANSLQMTRMLGLSMAGVANAVVDATEARTAERREKAADDGTSIDDRESLAVRSGELLPFISKVLDYAFRRHLQAASQQRILSATQFSGEGQVVGFVDLVGFTHISSRLTAEELTEMISRFETIVQNIVVGHHGRIVKLIGDEAMFAVIDPIDAAEIALALAERFAAEPGFKQVRVGLASGPVLARDGDLFGPTVNLASRLVEFGAPGRVTVGQRLRNSLQGNKAYELRSDGEKRIRGIGPVRTYRLRRRSRPVG